MATKTKSRSSSSKKSSTSKKRSRASTKTPTPAEARGVHSKDGINPVHVDSTTARSDEDARIGQFAKVVNGKHRGRYGVFDVVVDYNKKDGYPTKIIIVTRDEHAERIVVDYKDVRPAEAGFRGQF